MDIKLFKSAALRFFSGLLITAALLFISAGTLKYGNAWLFIALLFLPMFLAGIVLCIKRPALLRKRLEMDETEKEQKEVILLSALMFIAGFITAGLSFRFDFLMLPLFIVVAASVIFILAYIIYAEVLRENEYLSRVVAVWEYQKVIDTGLYGIVRHPMYAATVLLFLMIPLILGSLLSFVIFLTYPFLIAKRIKNEEALLSEKLNGYAEYKKKVKYKMIPFLW